MCLFNDLCLHKHQNAPTNRNMQTSDCADNKVCPITSLPVCGSDGDKYWNHCFLKQAACSNPGTLWLTKKLSKARLFDE